MDLELLTGSPISSGDLNDDLFGRLLDRLHECGCEPLFYELAMSVRMTLNLPENYVLHLDTTSHVLYGDYSQNEEEEDPTLRITDGYSKDKRKDLKQIMTGMVTDGDGPIVYSQTLDGILSDRIL
jgi:transposase